MSCGSAVGWLYPGISVTGCGPILGVGSRGKPYVSWVWKSSVHQIVVLLSEAAKLVDEKDKGNKNFLPIGSLMWEWGATTERPGTWDQDSKRSLTEIGGEHCWVGGRMVQQREQVSQHPGGQLPALHGPAYPWQSSGLQQEWGTYTSLPGAPICMWMFTRVWKLQ